MRKVLKEIVSIIIVLTLFISLTPLGTFKAFAETETVFAEWTFFGIMMFQQQLLQ